MLRLLIPNAPVTLLVCRACKNAHEERAEELGYGYFSLFGTHHNKHDIERLRRYPCDTPQTQEDNE